jgi:hypothetical protein
MHWGNTVLLARRATIAYVSNLDIDCNGMSCALLGQATGRIRQICAHRALHLRRRYQVYRVENEPYLGFMMRSHWARTLTALFVLNTVAESGIWSANIAPFADAQEETVYALCGADLGNYFRLLH